MVGDWDSGSSDTTRWRDKISKIVRKMVTIGQRARSAAIDDKSFPQAVDVSLL